METVANPLFNPGETRAQDNLGTLKRRLEARLSELAEPTHLVPPSLGAAVRHALLAPGKRIRPLLTYLVAEPHDERQAGAALEVACAVEMVHSASLLLDDLPCMDDARLRRGKPAAHIMFGQSTAILASVSLLSSAFGVIATADALTAPARARATAVLSRAIGTEGLVSGQELDVRNAAQAPEELARVNWLKTGILFEASAEIGALVGGLDDERTRAVKTFARHLGLAFQAHDDILDGTALKAEPGKEAGKDEGKRNMLSLLGVGPARLARGRDLLLAQQALAHSGVSPGPILAMVRQAFVDPPAPTRG